MANDKDEGTAMQVRQYDGHAWVRVDSLPPLTAPTCSACKYHGNKPECPYCGKPQQTHKRGCICARCEAEQRVLDAMAALRTEWLQDMLGSDQCFPNEPDCKARVALHVAELARRGLAP
jgi:hypothetical protein